MTKPTLAAQLYTLRQFTQTADGLADSLRRVRAIGYQAVQVSGIGPIAHEAVAHMAEDNQLAICITHIPYEALWHDTDAVIRQHQLWHCPNVAIGSMPDEFRADEAGYRRFAKEASAVGERLSQAGLTFSYHNHSFEFVRFGVKTGLDIIFEASDPRYLQAEIDTYWIQHGGGSPVDWVLKMKERMPVVHLKDMAVSADGWNVQQLMAEVGEGNLNWAAILPACEAAGVKWAAVEQDICQRDPFESLAISYRNLKAMGLS